MSTYEDDYPHDTSHSLVEIKLEIYMTDFSIQKYPEVSADHY